MTPGQIVWAVRAIAVLLIAAVVLAYFHGFLDLIRAPVKAELDASRGNQAALVKGIDNQNAGVVRLKTDGEQRQAKSAEAVKSAGKPQFKRADEIKAAPAVGESDYDRARNRIDRELGLR